MPCSTTTWSYNLQSKFRMLLIDFFKAVKKKSAVLFWSFLAITFFQLACTFLKIEVTPFILYGMYSEKIPEQTEFAIAEVEVNDSSLHSPELSDWQADILSTGYENYNNMLQNNRTDIVKTRVEKRYHFLTSSFLYPFLKTRIYNNEADLDNFSKWYHDRFSQFAKIDVRTIRIYSTPVKFDRSVFTFSKQPRKLIATF